MATMEEYTPGTYTNIRDNFRAYDSLEAGVLGYFEFTKFPNYAAIKTATTAEQYLTYINKQDMQQVQHMFKTHLGLYIPII